MARATAVRRRNGASAGDETGPRRADGPGRGRPGIASVVVPTHNDGANLGPLLRRLQAEPCVGELIVVASGCEDSTVLVACRIADGMVGDGGADAAGPGPAPVDVYVEPVRSGKAAAVNFGIARCMHPAVVIVAGDVLPEPGAVGLLVAALAEPGVGMAGGQPVPVNGISSTVGTAVHLLWRVHHRLALRQPKLGEMVALRAEAVVLLPPTSVDEACFQARLEAVGWRSCYVPEALIANRGPGTVLDFVRQRRQIHTGHLWLRRREAYTVPSLRPALIVREYWAEIRSGDYLQRPGRLLRTIAAIAMEVWARLLARLDFLRGRETHVWDMVTSAKDPALGPHGVDPRGR